GTRCVDPNATSSVTISPQPINNTSPPTRDSLDSTTPATELADAYIQWRRYFDSRNYVKAKAVYDYILLASPALESNRADGIRLEYQNLLEHNRQLWTEACTRQEPLILDSIRREVRLIDPSGDLNGPVLRRIQSCVLPECTELRPVPEPAPPE